MPHYITMDWKRWTKEGLRILVGVLVGVFLMAVYMHSQTVATDNCIKQYPLTSQSLDCDSYADSADRLHSLTQTLQNASANYVQQNTVKRISIWVRDLENKQWASINENERYAPASLMKLPLMIAYFKVAQVEPSLLKTQLVYARSTELNSDSQDFAPEKKLVVGQSYTVEQLIEQMIVYSDNDATAVLVQHLDPSIFSNTLVDLGVQIPGSERNYDFVTAKTYATIFRNLYNASYLNREYSEKALELLNKTTFEGLSQPLPKGTPVAAKFGERETSNPDGSVQTRELHDCGIVYKGARPYSICIMTEGTDFDQMLGAIREVSKIVYDQL